MKVDAIRNFGFILLFNIISYTIDAQCAMCKAGAEQSLERGSTDANWINYGILFLMLIPFVLMFGLYMLFRHNQKAKKN